MQTLAMIQNTYDYVARILNQCRRDYVLPFALKGGRDMVMLRNGSWIEKANAQDVSELVVYTYDSEKHSVFHSAGTGRVKRWKWIGTSFDNGFFGILRVDADYSLSDKETILLYASQEKMPYGKVTVILRDGTEEELDIEGLF